MLHRMLACLLALAAGTLRAQADEGPLHYAIVVGSNLGGEGQTPLQFAERDAERFAQLLTELGRADPERVRLLLSPSAGEVFGAFEALKRELAAHAEKAEPTQLTFFYSGHARANAANLGPERLPLSRLRKALTELPTTLTVAILDACQSGAFSGVKGAQSAADFSVNSVERLNTEGLAVLASSTATELSQESDALGASYFTHHLMVALRGAGDVNDDGRVSLGESYRYAYERTLADTSRTRIGGQHVTLEMDLKGKGDVPLSYPAHADAQLWLDQRLSGTVLVTRSPSGAVMAEVSKVPTAPLRLALPAGQYDVVVRSGQDVYECDTTLTKGRSARLDLSGCERLSQEAYRAKGQPPPSPHEKWFAEVGLGYRPWREDAYTDRLDVFGFEREPLNTDNLFVRVSAGLMLNRHVGLSLSYQALERTSYRRAFDGPSGPSNRDDFAWASHRAGLGVRGQVPLRDRWLVLYADLGAGLAFAATRFEKEDEGIIDQLQLGPSVDVSIGLQSNLSRIFGVFLEAGYGWAPVPENLIGDAHNAGGPRVVTGVRLRTEGVW